MLEKALSGSTRYRAWIGGLLLVILVGVFFYVRQFNEGLGITGMSRDVTWGFYIAQFTFLVGVAASAVMLVIPYYLHHYKAFGRITFIARIGCPRSARMNSRHMTTAPIARNSPRIVILPKAL